MYNINKKNFFFDVNIQKTEKKTANCNYALCRDEIMMDKERDLLAVILIYSAIINKLS